MPIITRVERQKNNQQRYSVFIDGKFSFALGDLDLSNSGLREGQELSEAELTDWITKSVGNKAYERALNYLSFRPRSTKEVRDYLDKKEFDEPTTQLVLDKLQSAGFVNDQSFATSWVDNRQLLKPRSKRRLTQELRQKGLSDSDIEQAVGEVDEIEALKVVVAKKAARYKDARLLINYLVGQGFNYGLVRQVLEELGIGSHK